MMSNRLFSKDEYKRYFGIALGCFVVLLFFQIIMPSLNIIKYLQDGAGLNDFRIEDIHYFIVQNPFSYIFSAILGVLGVFVFSYLHNKEQLDFYHSLPIKREKLFFIKYSIVPIMVISNLVIVYVLSYLITRFGFKLDFIVFSDILKTIGINIVYFLSMYSIAVFSSIISNRTIISIILAFFLSSINIIVGMAIVSISDLYLNGLVVLDNFINNQLLFSPLSSGFMQVSNYPNNIVSNNTINISLVINAIIFLLLTIVNIYLFKIRKSENTKGIVFKPLEIIIKYLAIILEALYLGVFFGAISNNNNLVYVGFIIGILFFNSLVEIVLNADFKAMFRKWKGIIPTSIIGIAIIISYNFDIFKIKTYVPEESKIKSIILDNSVYCRNPIEFNEKENIDKILEIYKNQIGKTIDYFNNNIIYSLKGGRIVERRFSPEKEPKLYEEIIKSDEFKQEATKFLYQDIDLEQLRVNIESKMNYDNITQITDKEKFLDALKMDLEKNPIVSDKDILFKAKLSYYYKGKDYNVLIDITKDYKNTLLLLDKMEIKPDNIDFNQVTEITFDIKEEGYSIGINDNNREKVLSIIDNGNILRTNFGDYVMVTIFFGEDKATNTLVTKEDLEVLKSIAKKV